MPRIETYDEDTEEYMVLFFETLNEKSRRYYAAVEAKKLGHGGIIYISNLLDISERTIKRGLEELAKKKLLKGRIRQSGGGRKKLEQVSPELLPALEKIIATHVGGCPVKGIRWTYLNTSEITIRLSQAGYQVSEKVVDKLLRQLGLSKRQMKKDSVMKDAIEGRDEQFKIIESYRHFYLSRGYAVLSVDVKKKEMLGSFRREGHIWCNKALNAYDHDYASFSNGKVVPHGIYDLGRQEGYLRLGQSADTAEFNVSCLRTYWAQYGSKIYDSQNPILLLLDGGGSNSSRVRLFKQELQEWADEWGLNIRVAHYPPYCSKYNPIEHKLFPIITRSWSGLMLNTVQTMVELIEKRTKNLASGLKVFVDTISQTFEKGVNVFDDYLDHCNIKFDRQNPRWNYRVLAMY